MSDEIDEWVEGLLADLKSSSTGNSGAGHPALPATVTTIEHAIRKHSQGIDPKLLRSYFERAVSHFDRLIQENDPYTVTLRRASARLSELHKRL